MAQENEIKDEELNAQKVAPKSLPIKPGAQRSRGISSQAGLASIRAGAAYSGSPAPGAPGSRYNPRVVTMEERSARTVVVDHAGQTRQRSLPVPGKKDHDVKDRSATVGKALGEGLTEGSSVEAGNSVTQAAAQGFVSGASRQFEAQVAQSRREHEQEAKGDEKPAQARSSATEHSAGQQAVGRAVGPEGEAVGPLENVGLVVSVYDNAKVEGKRATVWYVKQSIHPDDPRAMSGRTQLGLERASGLNQVRLFDQQMEALKENSESFPLLDDDGNQVGTNYVTRANLRMTTTSTGRNPRTKLPSSDIQLMLDHKTFQADPNLSTEPDVLDRASEARTTAKAAESARRRQKMDAWAEAIQEPGYPDQVKGLEW